MSNLEVVECSQFMNSMLYFDKSGTPLITRKFLQEYFALDNRSVVVSGGKIRSLVPGPTRVKLGYNTYSCVSDWESVRSKLIADTSYPNTKAFIESMDSYLESGPSKKLIDAPDKKFDEVPVSRLPVLLHSNTIELPSFATAQDIDVYSKNLNILLHAIEQDKSCSSAFFDKYKELPHPQEALSLEDMYTYCKELWHFWRARYLCRDIEVHLSDMPCEEYEYPETPHNADGKPKASHIGMPIPPDVIESACVSGIDSDLSEALEREYNLLISYIVKVTNLDYGAVKHQGYQMMQNQEAISLNSPTQKPVDIIRQNCWWDVAYKALWDAYSEYLDCIS